MKENAIMATQTQNLTAAETRRLEKVGGAVEELLAKVG
jgi:hypothetical protein